LRNLRLIGFVCAFLGVLAFALEAAVIPRPSPEYTIQLPNGQKVQLSQHRGKVVALEFILTTCEHCQRTAQIMQRLQKEFGPQGFQALGAAINDGATSAVPDFIRILKLDFPVGVGSRDEAVEYLQHPIMTSMIMPQVVIIDRKGQIQVQLPGNHPMMLKDEESNLRSFIKKLLETKSAPVKPDSTTRKKKTS
jgi:peroxiredoxin